MEWIRDIVDTKGIHLAVDWKTLRARMKKAKDFRAPMILNAVDVVTGLVVAQMPIKNKDYDIKAIPELLKLLDIRGSIVTTDAVGTQTQKEWLFVKTVGLARQIRIPIERDGQGNDITPDIKTFLEKGQGGGQDQYGRKKQEKISRKQG